MKNGPTLVNAKRTLTGCWLTANNPVNNAVSSFMLGFCFVERYKIFLFSIYYTKSFLTNSGTCSNNNKHCDTWAANGECTKNPGYMKTNCAKACQQC